MQRSATSLSSFNSSQRRSIEEPRATRLAIVAILALLLAALINPAWASRGNGNGGGRDDGKLPDLLTDAEVAGLKFMREEEKLARDTYLELYDAWGLLVFENVAESEQSHTDAIEKLLDRYDVEDPVADEDERGVFVDPHLQELYDTLMAIGMESATQGLVVGAMIEETDIIDIQHEIDAAQQEDIISTYESLMCGSRNHLRAFVRNLESVGEPYANRFLPEEEFLAIVESDFERDCGAY